MDIYSSASITEKTKKKIWSCIAMSISKYKDHIKKNRNDILLSIRWFERQLFQIFILPFVFLVLYLHLAVSVPFYM